MLNENKITQDCAQTKNYSTIHRANDGIVQQEN